MRKHESIVRMGLLWLRSRILRDRAARWNYQYAGGRWEKLKGPTEQARIDATALLLVRHVPPGRVLEIGCGEALLQQRLLPADYQSWLGVDISEIAIRQAQALAGRFDGLRAGERVRYMVADMETLEPEGRFDCIVFTESIYYAADCRRLLQRYSRYLQPDGVFIVSIFRTKRSERIWAEIHSVAPVLDTVATTNELGTWDCEVLGPGE